MIKTVALHEFLSTVKRKAYYLVTLGMPLILLAYAGLIALIAFVSVPGEMKKLEKVIGIVDESMILAWPPGALGEVAPAQRVQTGSAGEVYEMEVRLEEIENLWGRGPVPIEALNLPTIKRRLQRFDNFETAQEALRASGAGADELGSVVRIPTDYLETGQLQYYVREPSLFSSTKRIGFLHRLLSENILRRAKLPADAIARVQQGPTITQFELGEAGGFVEVDPWSKGLSMGIPIGVAALLVVALMMNSSLLLASVAEEKESRVMEVILSSVPAEQLLFGKVLGLVAAGLLQIAIWMAMVSVVPLLITASVQQPIDYDINVWQLVLGGLFVVLGFVFYGCLLVGLGSMGSTYKDCQQLTVVIILFAVVPMMGWMTFMNAPNGTAARVLSLFPLFAPIGMMLRLGFADVALWEPALSLVILLLSIWGAVKVSAKLFRVGTLMYGKRPGPREIWKAIRQPI